MECLDGMPVKPEEAKQKDGAESSDCDAAQAPPYPAILLAIRIA
jgi:hypothetical protein